MIAEQPALPSKSGARWLKLLLVACVVGLVAWLFASGALKDLSLERTAETIRSFGPWGFVVYLLAFTFIQPLGISGHTFTVAAALVWPPWVAFFLGLFGALGSALVNVAFARTVAFDWVQARIPARLRKYESWLTERGLLGIVLFRLLTFTMHPAQLLMGVLRVPLPRLIVGTLLGFAPSVAAGVFLGGDLLRWIFQRLGAG